MSGWNTCATSLFGHPLTFISLGRLTAKSRAISILEKFRFSNEADDGGLGRRRGLVSIFMALIHRVPSLPIPAQSSSVACISMGAVQYLNIGTLVASRWVPVQYLNIGTLSSSTMATSFNI